MLFYSRTHTHTHTHTQCPRRDDEIYAGELLLGIKFTSEDQCGVHDEESSQNGLDDVAIDNEEKTGQLQVHVVEGAGIVDELTHRPFNTCVKWYGRLHLKVTFVLLVLNL